MASAYEHIETRQGTRSGLFGGQNATTRWVVTCDTVGEDPRRVLADQFVPVGTPHPDDDSVVANEYAKDGYIDGLTHFVLVYYGSPLLIPSFEWEMQLDTALETELVEYSSIVDKSGKVVETDVPIGPHVYLPLRKEDGAIIYPDNANIREGNFFTITGSGERIDLVQIGGEKDRRVKGIERTRDVSQMVVSTRITQLTEQQMAIAESYNNTVNSATFLGRDPGTVKFVATQIASRFASDAVVVGQPATGRVYDIRLPFLIDTRGHQPKRVLETFHDEASGSETPVFNSLTGRPRFSEYWPHGVSDFYSLLRIFLPGVGFRR